MSLSDPSKKMSKSSGEKGVLYLFDEDYTTKLKAANSNEEGIENLKKIATNLDIDVSSFTMNLELKIAIAEKMTHLFSE